MSDDPVGDPDSVTLTLSEARELARLLESAVVSIHRITSGDIEPRQHDELRDYIGVGGGWRSLAHARRLIHEALDREVGEDRAEELLRGVEYWQDEPPS